MEEHFILRVPPSVAERLNRVLNEDSATPSDNSIDLSFLDDGRTGNFVIGKDQFPAALLDLPCVVESYKTYDDNVLIKTADVGQMIMVREPDEAAPEGPEYKHGLTPPMRDARRRRFRREPDLNPDFVQQVENDLQSIMAGGTARDVDVEVVEQEEDADDDGEPEEAPAAEAAAAAATSSAAEKGSKSTPSKRGKGKAKATEGKGNGNGSGKGNGNGKAAAPAVSAEEHPGDDESADDDDPMDEDEDTEHY